MYDKILFIFHLGSECLNLKEKMEISDIPITKALSPKELTFKQSDTTKQEAQRAPYRAPEYNVPLF